MGYDEWYTMVLDSSSDLDKHSNTLGVSTVNSSAAPQQIGRYQIIAELGRGSIGIVYQAYEPVLQRMVALKLLAPELTDQAGFVERLRHEAISAARLRHLNIAILYEFGQSAATSYLVMEYIPGRSLRTIVHQESLSAQRILTITHQLAQALDYMHRVGVIHRDIKPSNIMLGAGDHTVLIDFGLAYLAEQSTITTHGAVLGTPNYLSPEQAAGEPITGKSDQYALATVVYELLTGSVPFAGRPPVALVHAHLYERPMPPSERRPSLPVAVDEVLLKALAKNPAQRYASASAFSQALHAAFGKTIPQPISQFAWPQYRQRLGKLALGLCLALGLQQSASIPNDSNADYGQSNDGVPLPEQIVWAHNSGLVGGSALNINDNTIVTTSLDGRLLALDSRNGQLKWQSSDRSLLFGAPQVSNNLVIVGNNHQDVLALSLSSGGVIWRTKVIGVVEAAPVVSGQYILLTTNKGYVYVLQAANGEVLWNRPLSEGLQAPIIQNEQVLVSANTTLYSLDLAHGAISWEFRSASPITTQPTILDQTVIIGSARGLLHGLNRANGHERWQYQAQGALSAAPAVADSMIFVVDHAGGITAISAITGKEAWHRNLGAAISATPLIADNKLVLGTNDATLYTLNAETGTQMAAMQLAGSIESPAIVSNGLVYVRADQIYALGALPK